MTTGPALTSCQLLRARAESRCSSSHAHVTETDALDFRTWYERSLRASRALREAGCRPGDTVVLVGDVGAWIDVAVAFLGCHYRRCTPVVVPPEMSQDRYAHLELLVKPAVVVRLSPGPGPVEPQLDAQALMASPCDEDPLVPLPDDHAGIVYTSGTTGTPKAVAYCHGELAFGSLCDVPVLRRGADGEYSAHMYAPSAAIGHAMLTAPLIRTVGVVALRHLNRDSLGEITRWRRVIELCIPPVASTEFGTEALGRWKSVERIVTSTAPATTSGYKALRAAFPNAQIITGYSSTESLPAGTWTFFDPDRPNCVGKPYGGALVRIAETDEDGPTPSRGEIELSYPGTPRRRYVGDDQGAGVTWSGAWVRTGDLGYIDEQGDLHVVERLKDVVNTGGIKVASSEVEAVLLEYPSVREAAVFGRPHPQLTEELWAAVVGDADMDLERLASFTHERLGPERAPRTLLVIASLPRNTAGKVMKKTLGDWDPTSCIDRWPRLRDAPAASGPVDDVVGWAWAGVGLSGDDDFFTAGGDSLAAVELSVALEEAFGVQLFFGDVFELGSRSALVDWIKGERAARSAGGSSETGGAC